MGNYASGQSFYLVVDDSRMYGYVSEESFNNEGFAGIVGKVLGSKVEWGFGFVHINGEFEKLSEGLARKGFYLILNKELSDRV